MASNNDQITKGETKIIVCDVLCLSVNILGEEKMHSVIMYTYKRFLSSWFSFAASVIHHIFCRFFVVRTIAVWGTLLRQTVVTVKNIFSHCCLHSIIVIDTFPSMNFCYLCDSVHYF